MTAPVVDHPTQQLVVSYLTEHHRGRARAITARDLIAALSREGVRVTDRDLRIVAEESDQMVVADNRGYFVAVEPADLDGAIGRLSSQGVKMLARASRLSEWRRVLAEPPPVRDVVQLDLWKQGAA